MSSIEIGSYEAKTKLPELLPGVQHGNRYTFTLRGETVGESGALGSARMSDAASAVRQMQKFLESHSPLLGIDTKALIEEERD